ncbi:MAG: glycosyltransferase family 4 protein [Anaerolineales bacterium]|nr:glycosyltransferase family 4 protein [Anaerolineales bacterium]MDW8162919.1 glycosyltransferase family 4 protein [Anaerolineales bacterium]
MENRKIPFHIFSGVQGDTRRYRSAHLAEQLRLAEIDCEFHHITSGVATVSASYADLLLLQRVTWDCRVAQILQEARSRNAIILCDLDDLIFLRDSFRWIDSPDFSDPIRARLYQENLERNRYTIEQCEGVIVSTGYLAQQVQKQFDKPVWVHRNAFSLEMLYWSQEALRSKETETDRVIIGYASGTPTHDRDFQLIQPILRKLLKEYPNVYLHLIGHVNRKVDWGNVASKIHHLDFVPWRKLPRLLAQLSINIAPLRLDNPFSQSKSEIKYLEAGLVKVPTVASPTEAFQFAIRHGENGFLASTPEEWEEHLRTLIEDPALRARMGEAAYQDVLERYSPWKRAEEAVPLLNAVIRTLRPKWELFPEISLEPISDPRQYQHLWISEEIEKHPTLFERGMYTLKTRGLTTLLQEIWIFLRRLLAPIFPFK